MHVRKRWLLVAAVVLSSAVMTLALACSSSSNKSTDTPEPTAMTTASGTAITTPSQTKANETPGTTEPGAVQIAEKEYSIAGLDGAITSPTAGSVTFEVHNNGTMDHVFYVLKTDTDPANLPLSGNTVDEAKLGGTIGEIDPVPAGSIKTLTIDLQPGNYVLICNRPGHYQLGMHAAFIVQ